MRKTWAVVRREFVTRVKTRWFVVSTVAAPMLLIGTLVLPNVLRGGPGQARLVSILDGGDFELGVAVERQLLATGRWYASRPVGVDSARGGLALDSLTGAVRAGSLDGVLVLGDDAIDDGVVEYRGRNAASLSDMRELRGIVRQALLVERLRRAGVDPGLVTRAASVPELSTVHLTRDDASGASGEATFVVAYIMAFTLYIALFVYGQSVMRSVVEEKATRIVEVLASSMRPEALMAGKVIGVGSVGLLQLSIWVGSGAAIYRFRGALAGVLGSPGAASEALPVVRVGTLVVLVIYFVLGYFLFSALYAAVGAVVTTEQEAQQAQIPVTFLLIPGLLMFPVMLDDPTSGLGVAMSLIPFSSPIIMPVRSLVGSVPTFDLVVSIAILAAATAALVVFAARVYRAGILMYGKRASLAEIVRWIRYT